ncbi:AMP-binding protein [Nocardioides sp. GY 10127]|uniref:AMP-binding protein n=1 Tax=Nocardioides sp. GY 10127 TaxID=2569762 RepID=UPI0010A93F9D|nr:AMP-binding protein [Nocardioides sp. GY 10127]TIC85421.1 AMP-dependent synthetase [Nocardioides sp. GY 10127]
MSTVPPSGTVAPVDAFRAARDLLLDLREDHSAALERFAFPDVGPTWCWAIDWFDAVARGNDADALVVLHEDGTRDVRTFDELVDASDRTARWLAGLGIGRGDAVMVMLGNQVELWEVMLGVMKLGAVLVPTAMAAGPSDLADRLVRADARAVVTTPADAAKLEGLREAERLVKVVVGERDGWESLSSAAACASGPLEHPGTAPDDALLLYFTSGTTSRPKLVQHTQVSYPVGHLTTMYWLGLTPGDRHLNISSPGWAKHAWSCLFAPWNAQACVVVLDYARFDAGSLVTRLREEAVTTLCAPPTVWRMLINADLGERPPALREVVGAGEPLNPEVISRVQQQWGLPLRDGFGQTETTAQIANTPGSVLKPGSMGRPLPGMPVALVDPQTGAPVVGPGEGELCLDLSGDPLPLMAGYLGDPTRQAEATAGGFYHTGDVATRDEDGYLTYVGRTDDVFKASDYKISPFELESVLIEHAAVAEAAVVPAPDPVRLAVPKAYVALAPGFEPTAEVARDILRHARENLAPYLRVRRVEFFDLPKTISGKIRRVELRSREEQLADASVSTEFRDSDFPELRGGR